mmetsp:Transcript_10213/g.11727  ORF Transcript_10213/g.11727 Transcript_10213/m.11727 type:complete len:485 (+) Transcript_10213:114-1568(+)
MSLYSSDESESLSGAFGESKHKLKFLDLVLLVVGGVVGGGGFSLPQNCSAEAGPAAILFAWGMSGFGIFSLAMVFNTLSRRKPEIECGIIGYAFDGFGENTAFVTAAGYWLCSLLGNCTFCVLAFSSLGYMLPVFGNGTNLVSLIGSSMLIWLYHFLILRGVKQVALLGNLLTVLKLVPLAFFVFMAAINFDFNIFTEDFWGENVSSGGSHVPIAHQTASLLLVTLWAFSGIESACVLSGKAEHPEAVGSSILVGFFAVLVLFVSISVLSLGVMPRTEIAQLQDPSVAGVMKNLVGDWGSVLVSITLIISIVGALLTWSLVAAELPYRAAEIGVMPSCLTLINGYDVPFMSLWASTVLVQTFLLMVFFLEIGYLQLAEISSFATIGPYGITSIYAIKLALTGETYEDTMSDEEIVGLLSSTPEISHSKARANQHSQWKDGFFAFISLMLSIVMLISSGWLKVVVAAGFYTTVLSCKFITENISS